MLAIPANSRDLNEQRSLTNIKRRLRKHSILSAMSKNFFIKLAKCFLWLNGSNLVSKEPVQCITFDEKVSSETLLNVSLSFVPQTFSGKSEFPRNSERKISF